MRIGFANAPKPQVWTMTITGLDLEKINISFDLEGSITGPDGSGSSAENFISPSGQVTVNADDWCIKRKGAAFKNGTLKPGMKIRWQTIRLADDLYFPSGELERDRLVSHTVVRGLINGKHHLKLISEGVPPPITHIRVYRPMLPAGEFKDMKIAPGDARLEKGKYEAPTPLR
jgi:hypothetical protein